MPNLQELSLLTIVCRIALSILVGGILGLERGAKSQAAGFRTYILVCLGAAMIMMTNQYVSEVYQIGDPTRMGAQVVSGIGFLGAGTILVTDRNRVRGLTTAAGIWTAAAVGLAIGIGFYMGAIAMAIALIMTMTVLDPLKHYIQKRSRILECYVILNSMEAFNRLLIYCSTNRIELMDIRNGFGEVENQVIDAKHFAVDAGIGYYLSVKLKEHYSHIKFKQEIAQIPGVLYIEELK
ncbi:MAG: MgtC/SapB family protein [Aerococcaceae bacterium]|nr:MgtC/SapB family protein [Aerococcaceae bacterium]